MHPRVIAVVATYQRPKLLHRLLTSLSDQGRTLDSVVVVNNGGDDESVEIASSVSLPVKVLNLERNFGTGRGLAVGFEYILQHTTATHLWVLDDDVRVSSGSLEAMLDAQTKVGAGAVSPLVPNAANVVTWFPGPLSQPAWSIIRSGVTPREFQEQCGTAPLRWNWATWASLLVTRQAVETVGLPRTDFWYQATDIEYTLRLSARFPCVLAPAAVCSHLPPTVSSSRRRQKAFWSLQNHAFMSFHLRHAWRVLRHLPGNHYRYWRAGRFSAPALLESINAFWRGAVLGRPVGLDVVPEDLRDR